MVFGQYQVETYKYIQRMLGGLTIKTSIQVLLTCKTPIIFDYAKMSLPCKLGASIDLLLTWNAMNNTQAAQYG